uniref:Exocyst complex component 7 n=1 Tax=Hucho hucho TaxID=62062 RepID=A0A4W5MWD7_9TELE
MHDSTQNLLQLKGTIHYQAVRDTDTVIIQGPTGRLSDYLACVHRLKKAEEYFQQEYLDGPELNMLVTGRIESAKSQLESKFQVLLVRYSKPVQTVKILDVLAKKSLNGSAGGVEEVQLIPQTRLQDIISISTWLIGKVAHYAKVRLNQLDCSMKGLKDHKSRNLLCPVLQSKRVDSVAKKNKKTDIMLMIFPWHSPLHSCLVSLGRDSILDIDIETYMACITGFLSLAKSEYTMVSKVFPLNCSNTFETLIQVALNQLIQSGENIVSSVRRACSRHDYTALVAMLPVLGRKCIIMAHCVMSCFILPVSAQQATILFLQQLLSFADAVRSILYPHDVDSDTVTMEVSSKVLEHLQYNLQSKAKVYEDHALGAIFHLNNYNYILKSMKNFNEGLEELYKAQKAWAIPDRAAPERWYSDIPLLWSFTCTLHRCDNADFSKHPERYHKYSPAQVEEMIVRLFDISA